MRLSQFYPKMNGERVFNLIDPALSGSTRS